MKKPKDYNNDEWCRKCEAVIAVGEEDYRTCDTICCYCVNAFMNDYDITVGGIFYGACCSHHECGIDDHDGVDLSQQTYITKVKGVSICVHNYKGKFKINPENLKIRACYESLDMCHDMPDSIRMCKKEESK